MRPGTQPSQDEKWNLSRIAAFIYARANGKLTLSDARMLADAMARGPMADIWRAGVAEGIRRATD